MLKKLFIFFIALAPIAAMAQDLKLAYINAQEIFSAMPELSGIETQLTTKQEEISKNGQALVDEFNKNPMNSTRRRLHPKLCSRTSKNNWLRFRSVTRSTCRTVNRRCSNCSKNYLNRSTKNC